MRITRNIVSFKGLNELGKSVVLIHASQLKCIRLPFTLTIIMKEYMLKIYYTKETNMKNGFDLMEKSLSARSLFSPFIHKCFPSLLLSCLITCIFTETVGLK